MLCFAVVLLLLLWIGRAAPAKLQVPSKIRTVHVHPVRRGDFQSGIEALGTVTPEQVVVIHTQLEAQPLLALDFKEGEQVRAGQLLARIDPRPYQIAVDQAEAQLNRDRQLLENAQVDAARYRQLIQKHAVSDQTWVTQEATVRVDLATVAVDQATVANARLMLSYTRITSPLDGRVGIRQVDPGNLLHIADVNGIVSVTRMDPMDVIFSIPQEDWPQLQNCKHPGVQIWSRDRSQLLAEGLLLSHDNQIDLTTGTLKIRAQFNNARQNLFPNQFVNVRLVTRQVRQGLIVPRQALLERDGHYQVDLVVADKVLERPVQVEATNSLEALISAGLQEGQWLITEGTDQLRAGMQVHALRD